MRNGRPLPVFSVPPAPSLRDDRGGALTYPDQGMGQKGTCSKFSRIRYVPAPLSSALSAAAGLKVIAIFTDYAVVDRIIAHLKATLVAERPPPPQIPYQQALMAAETAGEFFS